MGENKEKEEKILLKEAYRERQKYLESKAIDIYTALLQEKLTIGEIMYLLGFLRVINLDNLAKARYNIKMRKQVKEKTGKMII